MRVVGLTGGMGAGKSTVARLLAGHGAHVIDADAIAREVVEPGTDALAAIADRFGPHVLAPDGALDRGALAAIVFRDEVELRALEAITHPAIRAGIEGRLAAHRAAEAADGHERVVVLDHPLLVETGLAAELATVVVVTADVETRVARLAAGRDIAPDDARARIAAQTGDAERLRAATHVVANDGSEEDLTAAVAALWRALSADGGGDRSRG